jgi:hypothetical protein
MGSSKSINQKIYMYYLVIVDHSSMAVHLTRSDCEGFYDVLYMYIQCNEWDWWYIVKWQWREWKF